MFKALIVGIMSLGLLSGCTVTPKAGAGSELSMNIGSEQTLLGKLFITEVYTGKGILEPQGIRRKSYIEASNFSFTCKSTIVENYEKGPAVRYPITCDDGSTGVVLVRYRIQGSAYLQGIGQGKMSDGRNIQLVFGSQSSALEWQ